MHKLKLVYKLEIHKPENEYFGHFYITVLDLENTTSDNIIFRWQCSLQDTSVKGWYACRPKWEHDNCNLLFLLPKIQKAGINWSSSIEEVINFLHARHIGHALQVDLPADDQQPPFNGPLSVNEILRGKFTRGSSRIKFTIPANQKVLLIEQIQEFKKMILEPTWKTAALTARKKP